MSCDPRIQQAIDLLQGIIADCANDDPMPGMTTPPPGKDVLASSIVEIPSNFDVAQYVRTMKSYTPVSAAPDVLGAFRLTGNVSHYSYDDPIVYPGMPGASHLHEFVGNRATDCNSTYESMRQTGDGTTEGGPVNRSGYWSPALILGDDVIAVPDCRSIYYKRHPRGSDRIAVGAQIARVPPGLRMISHSVSFMAMRNGKLIDGMGYRTNFDFADLLQPGDQVHANISFQNFWDGRRVDSPDHVSHVSSDTRWDRNLGKTFCPDGYPNEFAHIQLFSQWTVQDGDDWKGALFSSDKKMGAPLGTTYHGDYQECWDKDVFDAIEANALDKMLNCSAGIIGDGRQLVRPATFSFSQKPSRIPLGNVPLTGKLMMP